MYPVPWFSVATETPDADDSGTKTEYTVLTDIPVNHVYLYCSLDLESLSDRKLTYKLEQNMAMSFLVGNLASVM
jgi:hypothetical protein